jgi:putative ABC transport system permease protein
MFQNYFKIAYRNMLRNKGFSLTNLTGLTIGITCTMLILLWVQDELGWNQFHPNHKTIYKIAVNRVFNGEVTTDNAVPFPLADAAKSSLPEIKAVSVDDFGSNNVLAYKNSLIKKRILNVTRDYFGIFHWQFVKGSASKALDQPGNIVITESTAAALFGSEDPINKIIRENDQQERRVTGVIKDLPANSSIRFDCIVPFDYSSDNVKKVSTDWVSSYTEAFVEVRPGTNIEQLNRKITALAGEHAPAQKASFFLYAMDDWRLYSDFKNGKIAGGMIDYVRLFTLIAVIILVIACVNFMNLYTARSEKRAKEVGIRKTLGSERRHLMLQFYSESLLFSLCAFVLSVVLVYVVLPPFNALIGKELSLDIFQPSFFAAAIGIIAFTGLVSGSYPALYLSAFNPVKVLKGSFLPGKKAILPRRILVVLQFVISIFLISATLLVSRQVEHVKNRNLGYNPNNLITIPSSREANVHADIIKNELAQTGLIASVTRTTSPITDIWNYTPAPDWDGKPTGTNMIMSSMGADAGFAGTMGTKLLKGRDLQNVPADSTALLLNKSAADMMQLKDPVGMQMRYFGKNYTVVGVTDNIVMSSPYAPVMPMMVFFRDNRSGFFVVRLKEGVQPRAALARIEKVFRQHDPANPFEFTFTDEQFNKKFLTEDLIGKLTNLFAGLAILICCLGLSGLTSFTVERRLKEIGVRKILGASVQQLLVLISKEFLFLVFLAFLISVPVAWWLLNNWLQNYEYRTTVSFWLFITSGVGVLVLTLITVCLNALRAAWSNPVKNLRTE